MSERLTFEIVFESDFHIGAGHGGPGVDSSLLRDRDGVPVIRAAIGGLLRDAAWRLMQRPPLQWTRRCQASGLGDRARRYCERSDAACPLCRIFGSAAIPKRWEFRSARPSDARHATAIRRARADDSYPAMRVRVSPRTRRAEARKLFSEEQADSRLRFQFDAHTDEGGGRCADDAAFVVAAARALRHIGRGRRRGHGACQVHLLDRGSEGEWLARFRDHWLTESGDATPEKTSVYPVPSIRTESIPKRVRIIARAEEPILLASRAEAGNEYETRPWIPGTAVLGALAARVAARHDLRESLARRMFVDLFLRGRIRFSPLMPLALDGTRLVPMISVPLDLLTCKAFRGFEESDASAHGVTPWSLSENPPGSCEQCAVLSATSSPEGTAEVTPLTGFDGFVLNHPKPRDVHPFRRHEMHIAIDPDLGRVGERSLYGYVSLDAGQHFIGEIACGDAGDWAALKELADISGGTLIVRIGKGTRRGHGEMTLNFEEDASWGVDPWRGPSLFERVPGDIGDGRLVMTLLSDTIVVDPWLRVRAGFDAEWLKNEFRRDVTIVRSFCRTRIVDGFAGHLGLPRFRDVALVAGSTVGLRVGGDFATLRETLERIERDGIGLRREEGCGQVVFNHPIYQRELLPSGNRFPFPESFRIDRPDSFAELLAKFKGEWGQELDDAGLLQHCRDEAFLSIARLLRSAGDLETAKRLIGDGDSGFGKPTNAGVARLAGARDQKAVVRDTEDGRERLRQLLETLGRIAAENQHHNKVGLAMLADQVAAASEAARKSSSAPPETREGDA